MIKKSQIPDRWLYLPIILLGLYFLIRLIDQSKLTYMFPFDYSNDIPSYIASLFFLVKCGFHKFCPYWYNGFTTFNTFFPGWQFFTYPIYKITKDFMLSTYISIILMYLGSSIFIYLIGKAEKLSLTKITFFFLIFFTNPINVGNFFKLGRVVSLFGWFIFLGIAFFVFYFKKHKIDKRFLFFIPVYSFAILSHPQEAVLSSILIIPLFITKKDLYERLIIILSASFSFVLTAFWWIPFLKNISKGSMLAHSHQGAWLWATSGPFLMTSIAALLVSATTFITFYFYWLSKKKSKKELIFFSPILLLNLLFFLRVTPFLPILKNISPDPYIIFFLFFSILFFLKTNPHHFKRLNKVIPVILVIFILVCLAISHFKTPYFIENSQLNYDTLEMLNQINGTFIFVNSYPQSYSLTYYSYAPIFLNLSTAWGYYPHIISDDYYFRLREVKKYLAKEDCKKFISESKYFNVTYFIGAEESCQKMKNCGLTLIDKKGIVCSFQL